MRFYQRKDELDMLQMTYDQVLESSGKLIVITGRRRVGKTMLALKHCENKPHLYLFVAKKSEALLCQEFTKSIEATFNTTILGQITTFKDVFAFLLNMAQKQPFVLVIDEFQEFMNINPSVYSDIQALWDVNKGSSPIQLICLGSVYSLMVSIFQHNKEPLFGRADRIVHLRPFTINETALILKEYSQYSPSILFQYYLFTGGIPKYIESLITAGAFSQGDIIDVLLSKGSPYLDEGRTVLIEEFGKEYGMYFSILELISLGKTGRGEIESILQKNIGGYLERLDKDYAVIHKLQPITAKPNSKLQKYHLRDNFLRFWFRFIYRNRTAIESENFDYIKRIIERDFKTFQGKVLESFYYDLFLQSHRYNQVGSYWRRDGLNEIDLVAVNDFEHTITIAEVKMNPDKVDFAILKSKSQSLLKYFGGYEVTYLGLSLDNIEDYLSTPSIST